jgi:hypothetical protein
MKELLRGESTISLEAAVLKCPNAERYLYLLPTEYEVCWAQRCSKGFEEKRKTAFL